MKEDQIIIGVANILIIVFTLTAVCFYAGYRKGINHAITESKISVDGSDILIDLDGEVYIHETE